jgi:DNA-binding protein H-NS
MSVNLVSLSVSELEALAVQIQDEIVRKKAIARKNLLADLQKLARENGVELDELLAEAGGKSSKANKPKNKVAPKYRNPSDASQTWTGRGRQPLWVAAALSSGKTLKDLEI